MNTRWLFLTAALLAAPWHTRSAPFTYQGVLSESGRPAQSNYDLRFRIHAADTGGVLLAEPVYVNNVPMRSGHFVASLDFGEGVFNGQDRWLEIAVRAVGGAAEYTTLVPRQRITPAPYAITAESVAGPRPTYIESSNLLSGTVTSPLRVMSDSSSFGEIHVSAGGVVVSSDDSSSDHQGLALLLQAGNGMGPDKNGGNIILVPGFGTGTGRGGRVVVEGPVKISGQLSATSLIGDGSRIINLAQSNLTGVIGNQHLVGAYTNPLQLSNPSNEFHGIFNGDGHGLSNLTASTFTGIVPGGGLAGTYANALELVNSANQMNGMFSGSFAGDGTGLSNVTASALKGTLPNAGLYGTYGQALSLTNPSNIVAGTFSGDGSALDNLQASQISGVLGGQHLAGPYSNTLQFTNPSNHFAGAFQGDGTALSLSASRLLGTLPGGALSGTYGLAVNFANPANSLNGTFAGNGAAVSNVNASRLEGLRAADFAQRGSSNFFSGEQAFGGPVVFRNAVFAEGSLQVSGAVTAAALRGDGAGIRNVAISNVVGVLGGGQLQGTYANTVQFTSAANQFNGAFNGNGTGLVSLNASALTGLVPNSALSGTYGNALNLPNAGNNFQGTFTGDGSRLANIGASNLTGVLPSGRLQGVYSNALQFSNAANHFTGTFRGNGAALTDLNAASLTGFLPATGLGGTYEGAVDLSNPANTFFGSFGGDGSSLWNIRFTALDGVLGSAQLQGSYASAVQLSHSSNQFTGAFSGTGSALNSLNASALTSGTVPDARLSANVATLNSSPIFSGSVSAQGDLQAARVSAGSVGINTTNPVGRVLLVNGAAGVTSTNTLEFGANVSGKHANAGKIGYQTFTPGALDIIGAGTNATGRKIKFWAEGGAMFHGTGSNALVSLSNTVDEASSMLLATPFSTWRVGQNKPPDDPDAFDCFFIYQQTAARTRLMITDTGRVGIGTNNPTHPLHLGNGAHCTAGGVWTSVSDRNAKEDFRPVEPREVLAKVAALPITQWKYKAETNGVRHLGPMAQDFHAAFGLGENERTIGAVDADGVALAAIQGLSEVIQEKDAEIHALKAKTAEMEGRIIRLETLFGQINENIARASQ